MDDPKRCPWASSDPLYIRHHDVEWGVPVHDGRALWEHLVLDGFQAGLSWIVVLRKREGLRAAFSGFDPQSVARFTDGDVERLVADPRVIRSRAKIQASIVNARTYLAMEAAGDSFSEFAWSFTDGRPLQNAWRSADETPTDTPLSSEISRALKSKGFKFVGPVSVYAWMQAVGLVNDHLVDCFRHAEVAKLAERA